MNRRMFCKRSLLGTIGVAAFGLFESACGNAAVTIDTVLAWAQALLPIADNLAVDAALLSGNPDAATAAQTFKNAASAIIAEVAADVVAYKSTPTAGILQKIGNAANQLQADIGTLTQALNLSTGTQNAVTLDLSFAVTAIDAMIAAYLVVESGAPVTVSSVTKAVQQGTIKPATVKALNDGVGTFKKNYATARKNIQAKTGTSSAVHPASYADGGNVENVSI